MPHSTQQQQARPKPELKIGPFAGGIGVAVWRNEVQTEQGPRAIRSVTIAPRRYRDRESGEWKDSFAYRLTDLTALILTLEKAREHCLTTPLPGQEFESDESEAPSSDIPF